VIIIAIEIPSILEMLGTPVMLETYDVLSASQIL
jgi:hypothetical protein